MAEWRVLRDELDRWADAGRCATFWWRDDDAAKAHPALDRLLALADETATPLALAVIPAALDEDAAAAIAGSARARVLQHGYAHVNHEADTRRKAELGPARPAEATLAELDCGRARLADAFGARALPVLVPPWNRIASAVVAGLAALGFVGLSTYGARESARTEAGVRKVNTHIDIIDWRGTRGFVGVAEALALALDHLRARRAGRVDADEPTGLLTHHLVHDRAAWDFVARLVEAVGGHRAGRWLAAPEAFGPAP